MLPSSTALFLCANLSLIKTQTLCKQKPSLQLLLQSSFSSLSVKEKPTKEIFLSLQCIRAFIKKQRWKSHHLNSVSTAVNTLSEYLVYSELAHSLPSAFTPHVDYMHALWIQRHGMLHTCTCVACIQQRFPVTLLFWHVLLIPFSNYLLDGLPKDYCCYLEFLEKRAEEILLAFCLFLIFSEVSHMLDYPYPHLLFFLLKISLKRTGESNMLQPCFETCQLRY